jgi:hypothetical protein
MRLYSTLFWQFVRISPCTNLPCYPGVICTVTSDSYKCGNCPASYDGDGKDCELILTDGKLNLLFIDIK